ARARQRRIRARGVWESASVTLALLLRWPTDRLLLPVDAQGGAHVASGIYADDAALREQALRSRPDLAARDEARKAADNRLSAAWWDILSPDLDAGIQQRLTGTDVDDLDPTTLSYVFLRFTFSIEEIGRLRTARAEADRARWRQGEARDRVLADVDRARAQLRALADLIPEARIAAAAAERSHRAEVARFEAGTGLGIEVIEAQNSRARARLELEETLLRHQAAQMEMAAAVGRLRPRQSDESGAPATGR
ncbi:MAG: TolC family protein, partial [Candidatus Binatia bacterium]